MGLRGSNISSSPTHALGAEQPAEWWDECSGCCCEGKASLHLLQPKAQALDRRCSPPLFVALPVSQGCLGKGSAGNRLGVELIVLADQKFFSPSHPRLTQK